MLKSEDVFKVFVANKAKGLMCSLEHSWRAAGCLFLDNDLYVFSCEHTFPISCCCFSRLDKKFLFMHRVFQNWFGFFSPAVLFFLPLSLFPSPFPSSHPLQPLFLAPHSHLVFPFFHCSSFCNLMIFISAVFQEYLEFNLGH